MHKCLLILSCVLLLNIVCAHAEEIFYTNNEDSYYHSDVACNIPDSTAWSGEERVYYHREAYDMVEISTEAAAAFEKAPCPVCVEEYEAIYLGEHMPAWSLEAAPWGLGDLDSETAALLKEKRPQSYIDEISDTSMRFTAYFEEYYDHETEDVRRLHDYPDWYGGCWKNNACSTSYAIVSPTQQILQEFVELFGGGAWIVPVKYGQNQLSQAQDEIFDALIEWCNAHPDADAQVVSAFIEAIDQGVVIGIYGSDWEMAAAAMEEIAPIYVHFYHANAQNELT